MLETTIFRDEPFMTQHPPRPANVFRALCLSVILFAIALFAALFGVRMEEAAPGQGVVSGVNMVRLEIDERQGGEVAAGQPVRIESAMYPFRVHGRARGTVERVEPALAEGADGRRRVVAHVQVDESPFELRVGSSVNAEVIVGRKTLVRIILEH